MATVATINPLNQFFDQPSGLPLSNGKIYIGEVNKDPEQFPITVYWDEAGLVPAIQPIRTTSGYPTRNGSPAILYVNSLYSMRVRNQGDVQVFYIASAGTAPAVTPTPFIDTGLVPSFATANSFTVTGNQTSVFLPGNLPNLRVRMTLGSGFVYGTVSNAVFGALTTVTLTMDSTSLDASLSAVATSFLQPSPNAIPEGAFGALLRVTATQAAAQSALGIASVRQTVLSGPVDSNGFSAFGGSVGGATLTASGTLDATTASGSVNRRAPIVNPAFTSPAGSGTGFLCLQIDAAGVATTLVRTLAPVYQRGGAASTTNGQLTFNMGEMVMRLGNGSVANIVHEVVIGECPYTAGIWSGTIVWHALNNAAIMPVVACSGAGAATNFNHNIGKPLCSLQHWLVCHTAVGGWVVGDTITNVNTLGGTNYLTLQPRQNGRNSATVTTAATNAYVGLDPANGNITNIGSVNFSQYLTAKGPW